MKQNTDLLKFFKYVSFNVMSMIGLSCYILADTFFISKGIGADGLTALNLAIPIYSFVAGTGLMLGVGGATRYAIFRAQGQWEEGSKVFTTMAVAALVMGLIFMCIGGFLAKPLAGLLGAEGVILEMTAVYLKYILLFAPAFILNNVVNNFVRNDGNPRLAMIAMVVGSLFNIVLDYYLIFPMNMGMLGAVLATGFTPLVGLLILSTHFIRRQNDFELVRIDAQIGQILSAVSIGLPSLVNEVSSGIVMIVFNSLILGLAGNLGVAAYGIIANISLVVIAIYTGIAQGMQPVISDAYGHGLEKSIKNFLLYGMVAVGIVSAVLYAVLFIYADSIAMIFNKDMNEVLQNMAVTGMKLYFVAIPFAGFNIVLASYFASVEKAFPAQVISFLRGIVLIVPIVIVMAKMWGLTGVWLAFGVAELIVVVVGIVLFRKSFKAME